MRYKILPFISIVLFTLTNSFGQDLSTTTYFKGGSISYADSNTTIALYKKTVYARTDSVAIDDYSLMQYDMKGLKTLITYFNISDSLFKAKASAQRLLGRINGIGYYYKPRVAFSKTTKGIYSMLSYTITYKDGITQTYVPDIILPLLNTGRDIYIDISRAYYDELQFRCNIYIDSVFKQIRAVH